MMLRPSVALAGVAAVLVLSVQAAGENIETVNLKGWYAEVPVSQCHDSPCVCLAFDPGGGLPPFPGWVVQEDAGGMVLVRVSEVRKPRHCFRKSAASQDAASRLMLHIMLYRRDDIGQPSQAQIRTEGSGKTTTVYIEPVP